MKKLQPPLKKVTPSFPATSLSKLRSCQGPPSRKFGRRLNPHPLQQKVGVHTLVAEAVANSRPMTVETITDVRSNKENNRIK